MIAPPGSPEGRGTGGGAKGMMGKRTFVSGTDLGLVLTCCHYVMCSQVNLLTSMPQLPLL